MALALENGVLNDGSTNRLDSHDRQRQHRRAIGDSRFVVFLDKLLGDYSYQITLYQTGSEAIF